MRRLFVALDVLKKGRMVSDPAAWKNRQLAVTAVGALLSAIVAAAAAFGYPIPLDEEGAIAVASGLVTVVFLFDAWGTAATSDKVGLSDKPATPDRHIPNEGSDPARVVEKRDQHDSVEP